MEEYSGNVFLLSVLIIKGSVFEKLGVVEMVTVLGPDSGNFIESQCMEIMIEYLSADPELIEVVLSLSNEPPRGVMLVW